MQAAALNGAGGLAYAQGDYAGAQRFYAASLQLREQAADDAGIALALNNLGLVARNLGDYARATTLLEQSMGQCRSLGDTIGIAYALTSLGEVARLQGDIAAPLRFMKKAFGAGKNWITKVEWRRHCTIWGVWHCANKIFGWRLSIFARG